MAQLSPLRRRMSEDMTVRNMSPATQRSYVSAVSKFSGFFWQIARVAEPGRRSRFSGPSRHDGYLVARRQCGSASTCVRLACVRIPRQSGRGFRFDVGRRSDLKPAI